MTPPRLECSLFLVLCTVGAAACASSGSQQAAATGERGANCPLLLQDSVYSARGPVYRDCAVNSRVRPLPTSARSDFRPQAPYKDCYTAEVEFVVDVTGTPEERTARIARSNDAGFAESVLALVPMLRFDPAKIDGVPVRQITTYRQTMEVRRVVVAAGSPLPSSPPRRSTVPKC